MTPTGWQCPVCGRVWAPTVPECQSAHVRPAPPTTGTAAPPPTLPLNATRITYQHSRTI